MNGTMVGESYQASPLVDCLEIQNFRLYKHLTVGRFARANLIVGKNNAGKTTLLEALRILASIGAPYVLWDIINSRDESGQAFSRGVSRRLERYALMNLFNRSELPHEPLLIRTGHRTLTAKFAWFREIIEGEQGYRLERASAPTEDELVNLRPMLEVAAESGSRRLPLDRKYPRRTEPLSAEYECVFVGSAGVSSADAARLWDKIALTPLEEDVTSSLSMIYPGLERISMSAGEDERTRSARAKLSDFDYPVPLKTLGEGVNRIFGIVLALVNAKNGLLLIDEVENGIHYSVQPQLWHFLLGAADRLNVQIFATTHSSDAIRAFQWASRKAPAVEALLTRLENKAGVVEVTQFDESDLHIAVTEAIEVR